MGHIGEKNSSRNEQGARQHFLNASRWVALCSVVTRWDLLSRVHSLDSLWTPGHPFEVPKRKRNYRSPTSTNFAKVKD